jgi:hypothetical protein
MADENVERVVLTAEQVMDVMIEADRENRENETDVDWLFVADAVLRAIVPPDSVVVKREEQLTPAEAAAMVLPEPEGKYSLGWRLAREHAIAKLRSLARQEDTQA